MESYRFIIDQEEFAERRREICELVNPDADLPDPVFTGGGAGVGFQRFYDIFAAGFWDYVRNTLLAPGDAEVLLAVLDPSPDEYYRPHFGYYNWLVIGRDTSPEDYWKAMNTAPPGSPVDNIFDYSEKLVIAPRSGAWVIWGDRDLDLSVLKRRDGGGVDSWRDVTLALNHAPEHYRDRIRRNYGGGV